MLPAWCITADERELLLEVLISLGFRTECENEILWCRVCSFFFFFQAHCSICGIAPLSLARENCRRRMDCVKHVVRRAVGKCVKVIVSHWNRSWIGSHETQVRSELIPLRERVEVEQKWKQHVLALQPTGFGSYDWIFKVCTAQEPKVQMVGRGGTMDLHGLFLVSHWRPPLLVHVPYSRTKFSILLQLDLQTGSVGITGLWCCFLHY